jgi:hypothetical protein
MFEKFDRSQEGAPGIDLAKMTEDRTPAAEPLDSIVLQTPIGEIEFGPPAGVSLTLRIAIMMGEENPNRIQNAMLRTLMSVRSIDGKHVSPVGSMVEAQALANMLGDGVLDFLYLTMVETWPPPKKADLQILRKNKRVT